MIQVINQGGYYGVQASGSGLKVSCFSFGSWVSFVNQLNKDTAKECMAEAYEKGVNFFDNAEAYAAGNQK